MIDRSLSSQTTKRRRNHRSNGESFVAPAGLRRLSKSEEASIKGLHIVAFFMNSNGKSGDSSVSTQHLRFSVLSLDLTTVLDTLDDIRYHDILSHPVQSIKQDYRHIRNS